MVVGVLVVDLLLLLVVLLRLLLLLEERLGVAEFTCRVQVKVCARAGRRLKGRPVAIRLGQIFDMLLFGLLIVMHAACQVVRLIVCNILGV